MDVVLCGFFYSPWTCFFLICGAHLFLSVACLSFCELWFKALRVLSNDKKVAVGHDPSGSAVEGKSNKAVRSDRETKWMKEAQQQTGRGRSKPKKKNDDNSKMFRMNNV